jgi:hypothetical protein
MKKINAFLLMIFMTSFVTIAQMSPITGQINPNVMAKFPAHILSKLEEINSKMPLSEEKLMILGRHLKKNDSIANLKLAQGESIKELKKYMTIEDRYLKMLLTPKEYETYFSQINPDNRFLRALQLASTLKLTPEQTEAIRQQNKILEAKNSMSSFKKNEFYVTKLDSILDKKQHEFVTSQYYQEQARELSATDWHNLLKLKLTKPQDSVAMLNELYRYHLIKNTIIDEKARPLTKKAAQLKEKIIIDLQPAILTHYHFLANEFYYRTNLFSSIINFEKEIPLTPVQTDSLLVNYRKLEQIKIINTLNDDEPPYSEYQKFQNEVVQRIIEPQQLTTFLYKRGRIKAAKLAYKDWTFLEKQNQTKDLDKMKTLNEFATYHLDFLVAKERVEISPNTLNYFLKRDIELKKPELLQKLDAQKQANANTNAKNTNNELKW